MKIFLYCWNVPSNLPFPKNIIFFVGRITWIWRMSDPNYTPGGSSPTGGVTISGEANMMLQQFWPKTIGNIRALKQVVHIKYFCMCNMLRTVYSLTVSWHNVYCVKHSVDQIIFFLQKYDIIYMDDISFSALHFLIFWYGISRIYIESLECLS